MERHNNSNKMETASDVISRYLPKMVEAEKLEVAQRDLLVTSFRNKLAVLEGTENPTDKQKAETSGIRTMLEAGIFIKMFHPDPNSDMASRIYVVYAKGPAYVDLFNGLSAALGSTGVTYFPDGMRGLHRCIYVIDGATVVFDIHSRQLFSNELYVELLVLSPGYTLPDGPWRAMFGEIRRQLSTRGFKTIPLVDWAGMRNPFTG